MPGVGGTGVVTVSQILQMAAHLDGLSAAGVDQTGLAQKGGPVISDLRISRAPITGQVRAGAARADVLIGFDILGAGAAGTLDVADPRAHDRRRQHRAGGHRRDGDRPERALPGARCWRGQRSTARHARGTTSSSTPAALSERLFGDHMPANMLTVGAAFQHGCLPVSAASIEAAIRLNGAAVESNLAAFAWGRAAVADPAGVEAALAPAEPAAARASPPAPSERSSPAAPPPASFARCWSGASVDLAGYQGAAYARAYAEKVMRVAAIERERTRLGCRRPSPRRTPADSTS